MAREATRTRTVFGTLIALAAAALLLAFAAAPASARSITVKSPGPGPKEFDQVSVEQFGPKKPDKVLVLMPGTNGGAGNFSAIGPELAKRVPGLAVWAIDRRSAALEDTSMFQKALAGKATPEDAFNYYLGWISNGGKPADHYKFLDASTVPFAKDWGMATALNDARKVVLAAHKTGADKVYIGGHSLGASLADAYAAWDFKGKPGYKDVNGIVLIDGGMMGGTSSLTLQDAQDQVASIADKPFLDLLGVGIPEASGLFAEAGAIFAQQKPDESATTLQGFPLLPSSLKPPVPATNLATFGYAFDRDTSPDALSLLHINGGQLAATGNPRPWVEGGITKVADMAKGFGREPFNGVEWFYPRRLSLDTGGGSAMEENEVADYLGLRLEHTKKINVPLYAFQSDLSQGRVLTGAQNLIKASKIPKKKSVLVNGDPEYSHLDPLFASPKVNKFEKTVAKFLKKN